MWSNSIMEDYNVSSIIMKLQANEKTITIILLLMLYSY